MSISLDNEQAVNDLLDIIVHLSVKKERDKTDTSEIGYLHTLLRLFNASKPTQAQAEVIAKVYSDVVPLAVVVCPTFHQRFVTPFNGEEDLKRIYIENGLRHVFSDKACTYAPILQESVHFSSMCSHIDELNKYIANGDYCDAAVLLLSPTKTPCGMTFPNNRDIKGFTVNTLEDFAPSMYAKNKGSFWDCTEITLYMR